jgi:hypothetical protein
MRRRWWLLAVVVVVSMAMTVLPAGAQLPASPVPTPPVPSVPTPTVPTVPPAPSVPAPSVPVPTPSAPAPSTPVTVPSVTVPSVSTPSTSTSAGSVPSVSTPSVSTPKVTTPSVGGGSTSSGSGSSGGSTGAASGSSSSGSSGTSGGGAGGGGTGGGGGGGTAGGGGGATGGGGGGGTGAAGSTPSGSASPGGGATGTEGQSGQNRSPRTRAHRRAARVQRRERALRRDVLRLKGCLASVPRSERRVLALRAGVGRARPHSRTEVARITHLKRKRVVTLERRGLRRLRALGRAGACGVPAASTTATVMAPGMGTAQPPAGPSGDRSSVLAERHSSAESNEGGSAEGQRKPPSARLSISRPSAPGSDDFDLALVLAPLAVLAFLLVITREVRRAG